MILADLGADVVRVERPSGSLNMQRRDFTVRGRRSVAADLKTEAGRETVLRLAEKADVLLEGLRPNLEDVWEYCQRTGILGRTVTVKVKFSDFQQITRSRSSTAPVSSAAGLERICRELVEGLFPLPKGVRLLGVSTSNFVQSAQERLFDEESEAASPTVTTSEVDVSGVRGHGWYPGADVTHPEYGRGWVWGSGLGRVTVRFETRDSGPGPVRTFKADDQLLQPDPELPPLPHLGLD